MRHDDAPVYETPAHLYPHALVADGDGGDAPDIVIPEDLSTLSDEEVGALITQVEEAVEAISADPEPTAETLATVTALADGHEALVAERTARETAAQEAAAAVAAQAARVRGPQASDDDAGDDADDADADSADDAGDDDSGDDAGDDDGGDGGDDASGDDSGDDTGATADDPALVAGGRGGRRSGPIRVPLSAVRSRTPAPEPDQDRSRHAIIAAADVSGYSAGQRIPDARALAEVASARARSLRTDGASAIVASIVLPEDRPSLGPDLTREQIGQVLDEATAYEDYDSLVAAGGWCAPSERVYDFFGIEGAGGLIDVPTITVNRGGIEIPVSPSIAAVFSAPWEWSEDDDIDALENTGDPETDTVKPCFRIPCGTFTEKRLGAHGVCITTGNLSERAWPEQNRRYIDLVMAAHAHVMNRRVIDRMEAEMVAVTPDASVVGGGGAAAPILAAIEQQVEDYRDKYRMPDEAVLEAKFPSWVRAIIRADLSRRNGVDFFSVTNAQIAAWMRERFVLPQFIQDYQPLQTGAVGSDGVRESNPNSVRFMLYAAGTYVRGRGPSFDMGVVRDSRLNEVNDHIAVFTEETDLVLKRGHEGRKITVPIDTSGADALVAETALLTAATTDLVAATEGGA